MNTKVALVGLAALMSAAGLAGAGTFNVGNGDVAALKRAIVSANTNGEDDIINLAANGAYTIDIPDNTTDGPNGLPVIGADGGRILTINGNNATIARSGNGGTPVFRIVNISSGTVNIFALTITNGRTAGNVFGGSSSGAGIFNRGTLTMENCTVTANHGQHSSSTSHGAGIFNLNGSVTLRQCVISGNTATSLSSAAGGIGGGIYTQNGTMLIVRSIVRDNLVGRGNPSVGGDGGSAGGIANANGTLTIQESTLRGNSAVVGGGAIANYNDASAVLNVINSTISGNSVSFGPGGGISNSDGTVRLTNCTISGNSAPSSGGGVYTFGPSGVHNTIIAGNSGSVAPDVASQGGQGLSPVNSGGHNLIGKTNGSTGWIASDKTGTASAPLNPGLGPLQNNGGPTETMALLDGSPATEAGDNAVLGSPLNLLTDQRGAGFPRRKGAQVDIGAFETDPRQTTPWFVNTIADHDDGICGAVDCTLREAIVALNASPQQFGTLSHIGFAAGLTGTINLTGALPAVTRNVEINGPGADRLTVRRDTGGNYRIFLISNGTAGGPDVIITGLTLANGQGIGSGMPGGCIYNDQGALRIIKSAILGNNAGTGAGIFNFRGSVTVSDSTISGNAASGFGGAFLNSAAQGPATLTISNSTLSGNTAGRGAAIHNSGVTGSGAVTLQNCTFSGNSSPLGGIYNDGASANVTLRNTILSAGAAGANTVSGNGATVSSQGYNLSSDAMGGDSSTAPGGLLNQPGDQRNKDPILDPAGLQDNGGPTPTLALLADSPAINAGNGTNAPSLDQRGFGRSGVVDIGAFEFDGIGPSPTPTPTPAPTPTPTPGAATLANISTRLRVETDDNVLFGGFIITGTQPKKVIVRAIGPSSSVPGFLENPTLELYSGSTLLASNDDWMDSPERQAIIDSTIPPANNLESAIVRSLAPGAYTTIVRGVNQSTGVGLVEIYDLDASVDSKLAQISTRGFVQTGDDAMFGGLHVVGGTAQKVIVRAIGPSLSFPGKLADPTLELYDRNGTSLGANDNWRTGGQEAEIIATTVPPSDDLESAIVRTFAPGPYTAIVRGVGDTTGIALVEVYALN